jgi:hypothetical protein
MSRHAEGLRLGTMRFLMTLHWTDTTLDCRQISTGENVGGWIRPGHWHVLTFHGIGGEQDGWEPVPVPEFDRQMKEVAKLRDSGAVEIVTFKDGTHRFGQPSSH